MSSLNYNGQQLSYISTQSINHEPQYSEDGADYLHTEITIAAQAVINAALEPALGGETATQTMARIRHKLLEPRRQLIFGVGADELIRSPAAGRVLDAKNGPIPQAVNIRKIGGSETYLIDYVIKTWVVECPEGTVGLSYVSHRWSDQVAIDQDFKTTRTRSGLIIARSDMLTNADALRGVVATGTLLPGFRRDSSNYVLSKDGLQLQYTFVDKEVYLQVPAPAIRGEGYYTESSVQMTKRFAEVNLKLYGSKPKTTDEAQNSKQALIQLAVLIAVRKILGPNGRFAMPGDTEIDTLLESSAVRESLYENDVEVTIKAQLRPNRFRFGAIPMNLERFVAFPVGSDNSTPAPDPGDRGSAGLTLVAAALRDPCLAVTDPRTSKLASSPTRATFPPAALVYLTDAIPTDQAALYNAQTDGVYDGYQMTTEHKVKTNSRMLGVMTDDPTKAGMVRIDLGPTELYKQTRWSAMKTGSKPKMPSPAAAGDGNTHLLAFDIDVDAAEPAGDGVSIKYKRSGIMIHGYSDPSKVTLTGGLMPWVSDQVASQTGEEFENFLPTITNPQTTAGQSPFSKLTGWRPTGTA